MILLAAGAFPSSHLRAGRHPIKGVTSTVYDMTTRVLKNVETLGLDSLVAIGGAGIVHGCNGLTEGPTDESKREAALKRAREQGFLGA